MTLFIIIVLVTLGLGADAAWNWARVDNHERRRQ